MSDHFNITECSRNYFILSRNIAYYKSDVEKRKKVCNFVIMG